MTVATEFRQRAVELLENLPRESLIKAVEYLETLAHEAVQPLATTDLEIGEAALLETIQHRLTSEEQMRLDYLRQQNETGIITDTEHQELLIYIDRVERQDIERAEALIKLAQLRQVDLKVLVAEFLPMHSNGA